MPHSELGITTRHKRNHHGTPGHREHGAGERDDQAHPQRTVRQRAETADELGVKENNKNCITICMTTNNVIILLMSWGCVVIPSSEWGIFCYAHTVDGKTPRPQAERICCFSIFGNPQVSRQSRLGQDCPSCLD